MLPAKSAEADAAPPAPERCRVPDCGGWLTHVTDGMGNLLSYCGACEIRVRQVKILRNGAPVAASRANGAPRELTDEELVKLVRDRFWTQKQALKALKVSSNVITHAITEGKVLSIAVSGRARLIARESAKTWCVAYKQSRRDGATQKRIDALPRSSEKAMTLAELAARIGVATSTLSVWVIAMAERSPEFRRLPVDRGGARPVFAYWWNEARTS